MKLLLEFEVTDEDFVLMEQSAKMFGRPLEQYVKDATLTYTRYKLSQQVKVLPPHTRVFYNNDGSINQAYGYGKAKDFKKKVMNYEDDCRRVRF